MNVLRRVSILGLKRPIGNSSSKLEKKKNVEVQEYVTNVKMEPVNKTQTHQSQDASKANTIGANLPGCPGCDMRACAQANCCRYFYPPFPKCRACLENCEDLTFQQPYFFNPQFLQPFFHNGSISQNYCCHHGGISTNLNSEPSARDQVNRECGKTRRMASPHMFCQKIRNQCFVKSRSQEIKKLVRDKTNEKSTASDNESDHFPQCQNQPREQPQWNYQLCKCRESFLWASNPFIIPVVSYCVLWNAQNPTENCSNYSSSQMENWNRKGEDAEVDLLSNTQSNEKYDKDVDMENEHAQDCSEDGMSKKETDREHNRSSSSFLSLHSSTHNQNKIYISKKKNSSPSVNAESDANSEEEGAEELQIRGSDSSNSQNQLSVKSNENVLSNNVDYSDVYSAGNESQRSSTAGSEYDMKGQDSSAEAEEVDDQTEGLDEFSEGRNTHISPKSSLESLEEKDSEEYNGTDSEPCNNDLKIKPKMLITNFTVTNRTESAFQGTPKILGAGGDLGGDNCVGFKVNIESEETPLENTLHDMKQNFEIKQIPLKVLEEKKPSSPIDKTTDSKALRCSRTGIARLIPDTKSRDINVDTNKKLNSENKESDCNNSKRRHLHLKEENSKFQKDKSYTMTSQQKTGPEKYIPATNAKNRTPNKETKFATPKVRPHNCERNSRK